MDRKVEGKGCAIWTGKLRHAQKWENTVKTEKSSRRVLM